MYDLTAAEQAATDAIRDYVGNLVTSTGRSTGTLARAVVEAVRHEIEADALEALADGADKYGPIGAAHLRAGAFIVRKGRTIRDCLSDEPALHAPADIEFLLSELEAARSDLDHARAKSKSRSEAYLCREEELAAELEAAQSRLDKARSLHKPERRYTPDLAEPISFDTPEEAADYDGIEIELVTYFNVCSHCGSMEMGEGDRYGRDYRESLWPCADARALGLGEEGDDDR